MQNTDLTARRSKKETPSALSKSHPNAFSAGTTMRWSHHTRLLETEAEKKRLHN